MDALPDFHASIGVQVLDGKGHPLILGFIAAPSEDGFVPHSLGIPTEDHDEGEEICRRRNEKRTVTSARKPVGYV
jgi:hypothetical protein